MEQKIDHIKHLAIQHCVGTKRSDLVFKGPDSRRRSVRLIVENADGINLTEFISDIEPAQAFLRTTHDLATTSRLDIYLAKKPFTFVKYISYLFTILSIGMFSLYFFIMFNTL